MSTFRSSISFKDRIQISNRLKEKFPNRVPCIVEKNVSWGTRKLPHMERKKFLVPDDMKLSHLITIIRKRISLPEGSALLVTVGTENPSMPTVQSRISDLNNTYGTDDGFLYVQYGIESTFGY